MPTNSFWRTDWQVDIQAMRGSLVRFAPFVVQADSMACTREAATSSVGSFTLKTCSVEDDKYSVPKHCQ